MKFAVRGNMLTDASRDTLVNAYDAAAEKLGEAQPGGLVDSFLEMLRALRGAPKSKDVFGTRLSINDKIARAKTNGVIGSSETEVITGALDKLGRSWRRRGSDKQTLRAAYAALVRAFQEKPDGSKTNISVRNRKALARAVTRANDRLGKDVIPTMHIALVGQDLFGAGAVALIRQEQQLVSAVADNRISSAETAWMARSIDAIASRDHGAKASLLKAFAAVKQGIALNLIKKEDRRTLAEAMAKASERLDQPLGLTAAVVGEDVFGIGPSI